jgi:cytoskeletal protein RodZ
MSETLKKLHEIGIDAIHAKTHISIHSLKAILEERFEDISHIQYTGFLSIMEADLHMDMSELRDAYQKFREDTGQDSDERELFITTPKEPKNYKALIISSISILLIVLFISTMSSKKSTQENVESLAQNSAIVDATKHIEKSQSPQEKETKNKVAAFNAAAVKKEPKKEPKKAANTHPFVLYPQEALWIGVINLDTNTKRDTITSAPFVLDENANLLISLGHGLVRVELNGNVQRLTDVGRVRFSYRDGVLNRVSLAKFKELNKGKSW